MHKFIEVTSLVPITFFDEDGMSRTRFDEELELINLDNIAIITSDGNILLKRGYSNGGNVCKTKHTYEELKQMLSVVINY